MAGSGGPRWPSIDSAELMKFRQIFAGTVPPLIFPSDEFTKNCTTQPDPPGSAEDQQEVTKAFQDVITG